MQLEAVRELPEAENLIMAMLQTQPRDRPGINAVMAHPFWWSPARRMAFLIDLSDRVENEDREVTAFHGLMVSASQTYTVNRSCFPCPV